MTKQHGGEDSTAVFAAAKTGAVLIIGDEVLAGEVVDRNGPLLLSLLAGRGIRVSSLTVLPDLLAPLEAAVRAASASAEWVFVTGGIGPTHDDCTREAVARAIDRPLVPHPDALARLEAIFRHGSTPEERAMALLPEGAELLLAPEIGAFGFRARNVFVFPGVPRLLEPLLMASLERLGGRPEHRRELRTDLREGLIAAPLADLAARWPDLRWGSYPELTDAGWHLRLVLRGHDPERLDEALRHLHDALARLRTDS